MIINSLLKTALRAIRANKLRSFLTSLGIVAGVASIVVVTSISEGAKREIAQAISALGADRLDIKSGSRSPSVNSRLLFGGLYLLSEGDADDIRKKVSGISGISGILQGGTQISNGKFRIQASWIGVQSQGIRVSGYQLERGRNFRQAELEGAARVVLLGNSVASQLFPHSNPNGKRIRLSGNPFIVIGTLNTKGNDSVGRDLDNVVLVPLRSARSNLMGEFPIPPRAIEQITVTVSSVDSLARIQAQIESVIRKKHKISTNGDDDFYISNVKETIATRQKADQIMSTLLLTVAAVCLLVGGVGIMNIMLVSVTERAGEIGLRLAIGATPWDIRKQFLLESVILSFTGGILGMLIGSVGAWISAAHLNIQVSINFFVVGLAAVISTLVGLFFGYFPSYRASNLDPISSLRSL